MTEENEEFNVAVDSIQPANDEYPESRLLVNISSSFEDETKETENQRVMADAGVGKANFKETEPKSDEEDVIRGTSEQLLRSTRLSLSNEQSATTSNDSMNSRRVFCRPEDETKGSVRIKETSVGCDNRGFTDMQSSSNSLTHLLAHSNGSVQYKTHSEGEECNEGEVSVVWNMQQNSESVTLTRRTRYSTHHGTVVSDSFVNECICCCTIL